MCTINPCENCIIVKSIFSHDCISYEDSSHIICCLGRHYGNMKQYYLMKKYYLMSIDKGNVIGMNNLGFYYNTIEFNSNLMKKYFLMAIEKDHSTAMYNLGYYYQSKDNNHKLMEKYYLMAIDKGYIDAMVNIGDYYYIKHTYDLMKKYYLMSYKYKNDIIFGIKRIYNKYKSNKYYNI